MPSLKSNEEVNNQIINLISNIIIADKSWKEFMQIKK